jgi:hypothetical protein
MSPKCRCGTLASTQQLTHAFSSQVCSVSPSRTNTITTRLTHPRPHLTPTPRPPPSSANCIHCPAEPTLRLPVLTVGGPLLCSPRTRWTDATARTPRPSGCTTTRMSSTMSMRWIWTLTRTTSCPPSPMAFGRATRQMDGMATGRITTGTSRHGPR